MGRNYEHTDSFVGALKPNFSGRIPIIRSISERENRFNDYMDVANQTDDFHLKTIRSYVAPLDEQ